jgi:hypothetical protein
LAAIAYVMTTPSTELSTDKARVLTSLGSFLPQMGYIKGSACVVNHAVRSAIDSMLITAHLNFYAALQQSCAVDAAAAEEIGDPSLPIARKHKGETPMRTAAMRVLAVGRR